MAAQSNLLTALQKLSLFQELSPTQLKQLFGLCQQETYQEGQEMCQAGAESDRLFILLQGAVQINNARGLLLVTEEAVTTVGEVGVLTGERRSASVVAKTAVTTLSLARRPLMRLMQDDGALAVRLYRNVLLMVRHKLVAMDQRVEQLL